MAIRSSRERPEKILLAMRRLSNGATDFLKYEDIVVTAFRMFPDEFALRGHHEYPDSSDVHKPLYGILKKRGLVKAAQKQFALTARGVQVADRLMGAAGASSFAKAQNAERLTRDVEAELERMLKSEAYRFFAASQADRILDTDFYAFLGCTVRTGKNDFIGRLRTASDAVATAKKLGKPDAGTAKVLEKLVKFLRKRFKPEIEWNHANKQI
jgi:hypothetical protein